jgi:hypothetical protein
VPTFVDSGVSRGQRGGSPTVVNLSYLDREFIISIIFKKSNIICENMNASNRSCFECPMRYKQRTVIMNIIYRSEVEKVEIITIPKKCVYTYRIYILI